MLRHPSHSVQQTQKHTLSKTGPILLLPPLSVGAAGISTDFKLTSEYCAIVITTRYQRRLIPQQNLIDTSTSLNALTVCLDID